MQPVFVIVTCKTDVRSSMLLETVVHVKIIQFLCVELKYNVCCYPLFGHFSQHITFSRSLCKVVFVCLEISMFVLPINNRLLLVYRALTVIVC